jgi:CRP-like cAMP-binding protein
MIRSVTPAALTSDNPSAIATKALFEMLAGGTLPNWSVFALQVQLRSFPAGASIFAQGMEHPFVHVVRRGLVKNVYLRDTGDAWIKSLCTEGRFLGSMAALRPGGLASFSAVCIEDCELERIPISVIEQFAARDLPWSNMVRRAYALFAERKEQRERELLTLSAEDRYRTFIAEQPGLEKRISQKDLAAYLGITPVGLNRIVKRVRLGAAR